MPEVCGIEARSTLDKLREWIVGMLIAVGGQTDECFDLADYRQPRPYRMAVDTPPAFCRKRANGGPNVPILKEAKPEYAKTAMSALKLLRLSRTCVRACFPAHVSVVPPNVLAINP